MPAATVTSKGQITLPKEIRELLGVGPGDRVVFRRTASGEVVVEPATVDIMSLRGIVRPATRGVSVQDMKEVIRSRGAVK